MRMNDENMLVALDKAVSDTFEQMAFMEVCPVTSDPEANMTPDAGMTGTSQDAASIDGASGSTPETRWVRIHVGHPMEVDLWLGCPVDVLAEVSETVFCGMEFPEGMDVQGDTLAELANMIAGAFLGGLYPDDSDVTVGLPEIGTTGDAPDGTWMDTQTAQGRVMRRYSFDDGRSVRVLIHRESLPIEREK